MDWYIEAFKKYAEFGGRARRREFWAFFSVNFVLAILVAMIEIMTQTESLALLFRVVIIVPSIAVGFRRMHDVGRAGGWIFLPIANIVFLLEDSQPGMNKYGPNPKEEPKGTRRASAFAKESSSHAQMTETGALAVLGLRVGASQQLIHKTYEELSEAVLSDQSLGSSAMRDKREEAISSLDTAYAVLTTAARSGRSPRETPRASNGDAAWKTGELRRRRGGEGPLGELNERQRWSIYGGICLAVAAVLFPPFNRILEGEVRGRAYGFLFSPPGVRFQVDTAVVGLELVLIVVVTLGLVLLFRERPS